MPSVYKLNADALRVSIRLREGFGWYPTDKDDESQLKMFEDSVVRVKQALKDAEDPITPSNMRKSLKLLNSICEREADLLWQDNFMGDVDLVSPENPVKSDQLKYPLLFDSREACLSYAYAIAYALEACFDTYLRQQRNAVQQTREVRSRSNGRGDASRPQPPAHERYDQDNFDFDGHLVSPQRRGAAANAYGGGYDQHQHQHRDQRHDQHRDQRYDGRAYGPPSQPVRGGYRSARNY